MQVCYNTALDDGCSAQNRNVLRHAADGGVGFAFDGALCYGVPQAEGTANRTVERGTGVGCSCLAVAVVDAADDTDDWPAA